MDCRESYSSAEWQVLQFAPLWAFRGVAEADAHVDADEMAALAKEIEEGGLYDDPLVQEIFKSILADTRVVERFQADDRDMTAGLAEAADILDRKAAPQHAQAYKRAILLVARKVAEASGDDETFSAHSASSEEQLSLFRIADILGTSLEED